MMDASDRLFMLESYAKPECTPMMKSVKQKAKKKDLQGVSHSAVYV